MQNPRRESSIRRPAQLGGIPLAILGASVAVACCLACGGVSMQAARVREGLLGSSARTLKLCLGDAPYFEVREDGSELWAYTDRTPEKGQEIEVSRAMGQGTAFQRPRVESGGAGQVEDTSTGSIAIDTSEIARGQCVFLFGIANDQVVSFESRGRSSSGLNADALCATVLDRCIPDPPRARDAGS